MNTIARRTLAALATVTIALSSAVLLKPATASADPTTVPIVSAIAKLREAPMSVPVWMTRPCAEEDSANCYWDAQAMGNGHGHSFYARRMPGDITGLVCRFYVQPKFAHNHDHCAPR